MDGGLVNSIPLGEAIARGATEVYVLQVGRIDEPLAAPRKPSDVAKVAFEISRRHRFAREKSQVPKDVEVHVLPYGGPHPLDSRPGAFRRMDATRARISAAYEATASYLALKGVA